MNKTGHSASKFSTGLWWISMAIFTVTFLFVGYSNRLSADDFEFYRIYKEKGIVDAMLFFRATWNTRWASILQLNCWLHVYKMTHTFLIYHAVTLIALVVSSRFFLNKLFLQLGIREKSWLYAFLLAAAVFYASFSIPDTWFWLNTSTMYGWPLIAALVAAGVILSQSINIMQYPLLIIAGLMIGGGNEPFAVNVVLICLLLLLFGSQIQLNKKMRLRIIVLLLFTTIAFAYSYIGAGHSVRSSLLPHATIPVKAWIVIKSMGKLNLLYISIRLIPVLVLLFPFINLVPEKKAVDKIADTRTMLMIFLFFQLTSLIPTVWLMSEMGPARAWAQISLYLCITVILIFIKNQSRLKSLTEKWRLEKYAAIIATVLIANTGTSAIIKAHHYSKAADERYELLEAISMQSDTTMIRLQRLPPSGYLHDGEITDNPDHFSNRQLNTYFGIEAPIVTSD